MCECKSVCDSYTQMHWPFLYGRTVSAAVGVGFLKAFIGCALSVYMPHKPKCHSVCVCVCECVVLAVHNVAKKHTQKICRSRFVAFHVNTSEIDS